MFEDMEAQNKNLKDELLRICWYMRGSISLEQAYMLSFDDRKLVSNVIKDNIENVKKTKLPIL
jgi:hypothetical protein